MKKRRIPMTVSLPPEMAEGYEKLAQQEAKTKSLISELLPSELNSIPELPQIQGHQRKTAIDPVRHVTQRLPLP